VTDAELYELLLHGEYIGVLEIIREEHGGGRGRDQMEIEALALALAGRLEAAQEILNCPLDTQADPKEKATRVEAELVLAIKKGIAREGIAEIAQHAVECSDDAVIAHRVLGELAERARRREDALRHHEAAFRASPENDRSRRDLARTLATLKRRREALGLVRNMEPSLRRETYRFALLLREPAGVIASVAVGLSILATPTSTIAFWTTVAFGALLVALSLRWRDGLVFAAGVRVEILATGALLLREFLATVVSG
jgi:tetratricopeptide (TPR) repeat protein